MNVCSKARDNTADVLKVFSGKLKDTVRNEIGSVLYNKNDVKLFHNNEYGALHERLRKASPSRL